MDKSYVTLETAKLLKEKGFNEWCEWVYEDHGATHSTIDADFVGHSNSNLETINMQYLFNLKPKHGCEIEKML